MLKIVFALFVVGLATASEDFRWETIPVAENASQCIYRPEVRTLACRGPAGLVECPASVELGQWKFEVFGLRRSPVQSFVTPVEERKYELYPRKLDNTTYISYKISRGVEKREDRKENAEKRESTNTEKGERRSTDMKHNEIRGTVEGPAELYLYWAETEKTNEWGVRVTDKKCFVRLVDIVIGSSTLKHTVTVDGSDVELFGEVLIAEKPSSKRWLGFGMPWGLGLGGLGWGLGAWGWGLGWGLPLWG